MVKTGKGSHHPTALSGRRKVEKANEKSRGMRSNLVAASEEDLSPRVNSSPQVKQPGCPPGGEQWQSPVSREGGLYSLKQPHQPSEMTDRGGGQTWGWEAEY